MAPPTHDEIRLALHDELAVDEYPPTIDIKQHGTDMAIVSLSHPSLRQIPIWLINKWAVEVNRFGTLSSHVTVSADGRPVVEVLLYCQPEPEEA